MSDQPMPKTGIRLEIGGIPRLFALRWAGLVACQEAADAGPMVVYRSLLQADARAEVVRTVLLEGLRDAGEAHPGPIIDAYLADYPFGDAIVAAEKVMGAALLGPEAVS